MDPIKEQPIGGETDLKTIVNPENTAGVDFNADQIWWGNNQAQGARSNLLALPAETEQRASVESIDANTELRGQVIARYQKLLGSLGSVCRSRNIETPRFTNSDRAELVLMAHRIETAGKQYCARVRKVTNEKFDSDPEKATLVAEKIINDYLSAESAIIYHLAGKVHQRAIDAEEKLLKVKQIRENPKQNEWGAMAAEWQSASPDAREKLLRKISLNHRTSISSGNRPPQQPDYFYLWPIPHNPEIKAKNKQLVSGVNDAQERLLANIQRLDAQSPVSKLPTRHLRQVFQDLNIIDREIKIHLQPLLPDEPMVVDRLLTLLNQQPQLRDGINALKVRINGNCQPEPSGHYLPEIVIYTSGQFQPTLLAALQKEFCDLIGNGLTPRFNQELANQFLYIAQSGGDLKENLAQINLLDKFFDKDANYARLRV